MIYYGRVQTFQILAGIAIVFLVYNVFKLSSKARQRQLFYRIYALAVIIKLVDLITIFLSLPIEQIIAGELPIQHCDFCLVFLPIAYLYIEKNNPSITTNRIIVYYLLIGQIVDLLFYLKVSTSIEEAKFYFYNENYNWNYLPSDYHMTILSNNFFAHLTYLLLILIVVYKSNFLYQNPFPEIYKTFMTVSSFYIVGHILNLIFIASGYGDQKVNYMTTIDAKQFYAFLPTEMERIIYNFCHTKIIYSLIYILLFMNLEVILAALIHYVIYKILQKQGKTNIFYLNAINLDTNDVALRYQ